MIKIHDFNHDSVTETVKKKKENTVFDSQINSQKKAKLIRFFNSIYSDAVGPDSELNVWSNL